MSAGEDGRPSLLTRLLLRNRRIWVVVRDTVVGVWADGFTHAGNLAYLSLLTLFPFFIVLATVAGSVGRTDYGMRAVTGFMRLLPPDVAALVAKPIADVTEVRASAGLLTLGILVTLWTVTSFIETIRDIIRKAYGSSTSVPVWRYRIASLAFVFAAVILMLTAFAAQVLLTGAETFVAEIMPRTDAIIEGIGFRRRLPAIALFVALYAIFYALTPKRFRAPGFIVWPGALVTTVTWVGTTTGMPWALGLFGGYSLTYGSLAGVIVALLFFYIIGLGLVAGAHLNAALAKATQRRLKAQGNDVATNGATWPE
nr:YihY/virulence factor BrkB family protein [Polymorphobacter sp.]